MTYRCVHCTFEHYQVTERCKMCGLIQFTNNDIASFVNGGRTAKGQQLDRMNGGNSALSGTNTPQVGTNTGKNALSDEDKRRIEENRRKAREKREKKKREEELSRANTQQARYEMSKQSRGDFEKPQDQNNGPATQSLPSSINPFTTAEAQKYVEGPVPLDTRAMMTYIYPKNYEVRKYQQEMTRTALFNNTIICLPTGLGKTMIASCVMYNFDRWFPEGIIIFMAPTKPLVEQQIGSCYGVTGMPESRTAVMTGGVKPQKRAEMWKTHSFFFATPQTVLRDLENGVVPVDKVTCVILDEAHKATGDFAYVRVIRIIDESKARYRIVGLSATPGQNRDKVNEIIRNLRAAKMEYRTEEDVKEYINNKEIEEILVEQPTEIRECIKCIDACLSDLLKECERLGILQGNHMAGMQTSSGFVAIKLRQDWHQRHQDNPGRKHMFNVQFDILRRLFDMKGTITSHGIKMTYNKLIDFQQSYGVGQRPNKKVTDFMKSPLFVGMENKITERMNKTQSSQISQEDNTDATILTKDDPKMARLVEVLNEHFQKFTENKSETRAIVFSQWRDSVTQIVTTLTPYALLKPKAFVGQASTIGKVDGVTKKGMNQDAQQEAIRHFRSGRYNILVCTSIGEEGLDIGEVDLIVQIDALSSSIRSTQRAGRTGRKRDGRVVYLLSEGPEMKKYQESKNKQKKMNEQMKNMTRNYQFLSKQYSLFPTSVRPREVLEMISISHEFRSSQVGGHTPKQKRKRRKSSMARYLGDWKLTLSQEKSRVSTFGMEDDVGMKEMISLIGSWQFGDEKGMFPRKFRKRLLSNMSFDAHSLRNDPRNSFGTMPVGSKGTALRELHEYVNEDRHGDEQLRRLFNGGGGKRGGMRLGMEMERRRGGESESDDNVGKKRGRNAIREKEGEVEEVEEGEGEGDPIEMYDDFEFGMNDDEEDRGVGDFGKDDERFRTSGLGDELVKDTKCALDVNSITPKPRKYNSNEPRAVFELSDKSKWVESNFILASVTFEGGGGRGIGGGDEEGDDSILKDQGNEVENSNDSNPKIDGSGPIERGMQGGNGEDRDLQEIVPTTKEPASESSSWSCKKCTFSNQVSEVNCTVCGTPRFPKAPPKAARQQTLSFSSRPPKSLKPKFEVDLLNNDDSSSGGDSDSDDDDDDDRNTEIIMTDTRKPVEEKPKPTKIFEINEGLDSSSSKEEEDGEDEERLARNKKQEQNRQQSNPSRNFEVVNIASSESEDSSSEDEGKENRNNVSIGHQTPQTSKLLSSLKPTQESSDYVRKTDKRRVLFDDSQSTTLTFDARDESDVVCEICLDGESSIANPILYCDGKEGSCTVVVHKLCYGVSEVPRGQFLCHTCRDGNRTVTANCGLCGVRDSSALSKTEDNDFVHPVCMWWNKEWCSMDEKHYSVEKVKKACPKRQTVACEICKRGGAMECMHGDCLRAVHPHCGRSIVPKHQRWLLRTRDVEGVDGTKFEIFCDEHQDLVSKSKGDIGIYTDFGWEEQLVWGGKEDGGITLTQCLEDSGDEEAHKGGATGRLKERNRKKRRGGGEGEEGGRSKKKLKQKKKKKRAEDMTEEEKIANLGKMKRQERGRAMARRFMDLEAGINSDEESGEFEGDDDSAGSMVDFINDSSDFGSLRCSLDDIDGDNIEEEGVLHRQLDTMNEPVRFTTPVLKRRRSSGVGRASYGSDQGLGQMHFIRSVVEHHNDGGIASAVEDEYLRLEELGEEGEGSEEVGGCWESGEDESLTDSFGCFQTAGAVLRANESAIVDFNMPVKGTVVMLSFPQGGVYRSKVINGVVETANNGVRCIKVESVNREGKKADWSEDVPVSEWKKRFKGPDVEEGKGLINSNGLLKSSLWDSSGPPKPLSWPQNWSGDRGAGGGGTVVKNPYAKEGGVVGAGTRGKPQLSEEAKRNIEEKKAEAKRKRERKQRMVAGGL